MSEESRIPARSGPDRRSGDRPGLMLGRVLRASTTEFNVGCQPAIADQPSMIPPLGALVKAAGPTGDTVPSGDAIYGFVYNVSVDDDPFVRQLVAAGVENEDYIADQRQRRQVPVVVGVLVIGGGRGLDVYHRLPPAPPATLDRIYACNAAEVVRVTARLDWLRTVLTAANIPADQTLVAALRSAAQARPPDQREGYLLAAGRELARLLAMDLGRLEGILRQLQD